MPREYIEVHASALSRYQDCPRKAAARIFKSEVPKGYLVREETTSIGAHIGNAVHRTMAELFRQKAENGWMNVEEAAAKRDLEFLADVESGTTWDATTKHVETAKKQVIALCGAFYPIAELTDPLDWETKLEAWVSPLGNQAIPVKLVGTRDLKDKRFEIHDHKSGKSFPHCHAQGGGYAILDIQNGGEVRAFRVNFAPRLGVTKLSETRAESVRLDLDTCIKLAWNVIADIQRHYEKFAEAKDQDAFPVNPYSMTCNENYCNVWGTPWCKVGCIKS